MLRQAQHKFFMSSTVRQFFLLGVLVVLLSGLLWMRSANSSNSEVTSSVTIVTPTSKQKTVAAVFSYKGEEGIDALSLLEQQVPVVQNESGLVTSINGRKADEQKREFWSFYVNGKMAPVGPKEYITKDGDSIEWRIETY